MTLSLTVPGVVVGGGALETEHVSPKNRNKTFYFSVVERQCWCNTSEKALTVSAIKTLHFMV